MATRVSSRRPNRVPRTPASGARKRPTPLHEYRLRRRVQFHETDMAGIVHFSSYFKYVEEAEHALWRAAGLSISAPGGAIGWPRVHASLDYHAPLRFEEEFDIVVAIAAMTDKTIRYRFLLSRDGTRIASGAMTIVCVRKTPKPMRAVSIPAEISRRFRVSPLPPS